MVQECISIYKHRIKDSYSHLYNAKGVCVGSFGKIFNEYIH